MRKKHLLIDEYPLQVLPSLAKTIGLNEAIALQQLHYWLEMPKGGVEIDGVKWIYNTYEEWQKDNFPFWSKRTIQRTFLNLEKDGLVISKQHDATKYDRKKYYTIDYDKVDLLKVPDCPPRDRQGDCGDSAKLAPSLNESETTTENKKTALSSMPLDWKLAHGETVTEEDVKQTTLENNAPIVFEKVFGFGTLPWSSNTTWTKFYKFIVDLYASDPNMFSDYVAWREGEGKYKAFSNRKIRENPQAFMDTGYPEYEASKMYRKTDETRPEYQYVKPEDKGKYVPRPQNIPRPNIRPSASASD